MPYELRWEQRPEEDADLIDLVDPVMAAEVRAAADLVASDPLAYGVPVRRPFYSGFEYRFLVRDRIRVRINFAFVPGRNWIAVRRLVLNRLVPPATA